MCPGFVEPGHITSSERSGRHHVTGQTGQIEAELAGRSCVRPLMSSLALRAGGH
jgi:hypothetical protein